MKTALVMLAAGQSRRFGGLKQLALFRGQPMVCHSLSQLPTSADNYYLVLGAQWQKIAKVVQDKSPRSVELLVAPDWQLGLGHSLRFAISQLEPAIERVMICLADQVALKPHDYEALLALSEQHPGCTVAAYYRHSLGVPAIFCRAEFSALMQLSGDKGAKALLNQNPDKVIQCDLPQAAIDIDTQQDLINTSQIDWQGREND